MDRLLVEPTKESEGSGYAGVWVTRGMHTLDDIDGVYLFEIEALRAVNSRGYGVATFAPWGATK